MSVWSFAPTARLTSSGGAWRRNGVPPTTITMALPDRRLPRREPCPAGEPAAYGIVQLLALAHAVERATDDGTATRADVARALGLTRARLSQICGLAFLAPEIQAELITAAPRTRVTERSLRKVMAEIDWGQQRVLWRTLATRAA